MKFCKYCGSQLEENVLVCPQCNKDLSPTSSTIDSANSQNPTTPTPPSFADKFPIIKKPIVWGGIAVLFIVIMCIVIGNGKCDYGACKNKAVSGYDYCYSHKCAVPSCNDSYFLYSNYCYSHYLIYDDDASSSSNYVPSYQLKISDVSVYTSRNYTYAEGTFKNNSDSTVSYVRIKGSFKTHSGTVVDTDWTYAVGSEGLAPGESCKWKLSVEKDYSIEDCDISILDYDY